MDVEQLVGMNKFSLNSCFFGKNCGGPGTHSKWIVNVFCISDNIGMCV